MNNYNRKGLIILIIIVIITGMGIINLRGIPLPYFNWLEKGVYNITSPFVEYFNKIYKSVASYYYGLMNTDDIIAENRELNKEVMSLQREIQQLTTFEKQNKRLRELLAFRNYIHYKTLGATVIGFGPSNWEYKILIDRGKDDGVKEKMPVISYNGTLVGRVDYVGDSTSQVELIYDPGFIVGGVVQREDSRAIGLVKGQINNKNINIMEKIAWDADIKKDDLILTSGLSNSYPRGLPIGKATSVETDNYGLSLKAEIKLFASLKTLEEVLVITEF